MAKKRKVAARKPTTPAAESAAKPRAKASQPKRPSSTSSSKPAGNARGKKFASFEDAKSSAIDSLIYNIEEAERRLSAVKRASTVGELQRIAKVPLT